MNNPKSESKEEKDMKEKSTTDKKIGARKRRKSTVEKSMEAPWKLHFSLHDAFNQFKETAKDDFERYMINYTYQDVLKVEGVKSNRLNLRLFDL